MERLSIYTNKYAEAVCYSISKCENREQIYSYLSFQIKYNYHLTELIIGIIKNIFPQYENILNTIILLQ